ncbi:ankyrin repeat-containing domain protein, partial [Cladorrhinum sp. PSN332]
MGKQGPSFEDHYDLIKHLYIVEDKTLLEVMDVMKQKGVDKSKRAYERWFSKWGFRKNADWKVIGGTVEKRRATGKQTVIQVNPFKRRGEEWVRKKNSRRFVSCLDQIKMNQSLRREGSSSEATTLSTTMVIRSPSPVFTGTVQESGTIPSLWHQFQDLLQVMGIPVMARTATTGGASPPGSTDIIADWHPLDNTHILHLFPRIRSISNYNPRQLIRRTEMEIRNTVPERHQNEHRQLAELLCTKRGADTIQYYMLQLFKLANNFIHEPFRQREDLDVDVIHLVGAMESKWPGKLKVLLELDDWVIRAAKEKVFASALREGKPEIIHVILEAGFNPNRVVDDPTEGWRENPAIYVAVGLRDENIAVRIVQLLISCEHRLGADAQSGALHRALSMGRNAIANIFLEAEMSEAKNCFIAALQCGDLDLVRQILDARPDLLNISQKYHISEQRNPLGLAVEAEDLNLVNLLLTFRGIDVNGSAQELEFQEFWPLNLKTFTTPLGLAAWKGNLSMVQLLLQNGATPDNAFPLLAACYGGHAEIAMALLKKGFEAKEGDSYANTLRVPDKTFTALGRLEQLTNYTSCIGTFAAHFKDEDCIHQELLEHLIQQGARTDEGFLVAISYGNLPLLKLLLPHLESTPFTWDDFGKTPLDVAVENGPLTIVEFLVGAGFTEFRNTERISSGVAAMFIEHGGNHFLPAILKSTNGTSILSYAIQSQDWGLVEHLLRYDIDLSQPAQPSLPTPLELAVRLGDVDLISRLLSRKALITARVWTSFRDCPQLSDKVLKVLLSSLDQDTRHMKPDSGLEGQPLLQAVETRNHNFVKLFLEAECWNAKYLGKSLTAAVFYNEGYLVQLLLNAGASLEENTLVRYKDIHRPVRIGYEALRDGSLRNVDPEYIDILLKAGANPNYGHSPSRDLDCSDGLTPIQSAASWGNLPVLSLLIENGADVNVFAPRPLVGGSDATALQFAAIYGHLQMAELLLQNGADINAPAANYCGRTTLEGAAENGRLEMVRFLLISEAKLKISGPYRIHFLRAVKLANDNGHKEVAEFLK